MVPRPSKRPEDPGPLGSIPFEAPPKPRAAKGKPRAPQPSPLEALMADEPTSDAVERALLDVGEDVDLLTEVPGHMVLHMARMRWFAGLLERREVDFHELDRLLVHYLRLNVSRDRKSRGELTSIFTAREEKKRFLLPDDRMV